MTRERLRQLCVLFAVSRRVTMSRELHRRVFPVEADDECLKNTIVVPGADLKLLLLTKVPVGVEQDERRSNTVELLKLRLRLYVTSLVSSPSADCGPLRVLLLRNKHKVNGTLTAKEVLGAVNIGGCSFAPVSHSPIAMQDEFSVLYDSYEALRTMGVGPATGGEATTRRTYDIQVDIGKLMSVCAGDGGVGSIEYGGVFLCLAAAGSGVQAAAAGEYTYRDVGAVCFG